jgi:hypothetical protein
MNSILKAAVVLMVLWNNASAQPTNTVLWRAERVQYTLGESKPYWAWIILPADDNATNGVSFPAVVNGIFGLEPTPLIKHICLHSVHRGAAMQKQVIERLKNTLVLKKYPTRHGADGRMNIGGTSNPLNVEMRRLVKAAVLETTLVREMDEALLPRGLRIGEVATEKLCIFAERGTQHWDGIIWLLIKKTEADDAANGRQPIRSETNRTSSAAGSRR